MNRYKIVRELGCNREGGRITYLATDTSLNPPQEVVIKEFRFALVGANWSGFKAYQREIELLRELGHPRIPRYLDSFETETGFCLVQEYKNAPSLAERRSFDTEEIKQIAVSVLEILVYLQKRVPPVIHRDIKPENILVDKQLNAYLIDFGFARIRGGELALSSVAAGTPGFMPPEEQFGRPLTEASDLYSLGATLICLLTGTRSVDAGNLIDDDYRFDFKKLVPQLSPSFISWLEKMVAPNVKQRYANAVAALEVLKPIWVVADATRQEIPVGFNAAAALEALKPIQVVGDATRQEIPVSFNAAVASEVPKPIRVVGGVARQEIPVSAIKRRKAVARVGLATIGIIAGVWTTWMIFGLSWQRYQVRQLLETRQCQKCYLRGANLMGVNLMGVNRLDAANLWGTKLRDANLEGAKLGNVRLQYADLRGANLQGANLQRADLIRANLQGAKLKGADLQGASLQEANLWGADLRGAKLRGAKLKRAIMPNGTRHE